MYEEIKIRAWDKNNNEMYYSDCDLLSLDFNNKWLWVATETGEQNNIEIKDCVFMESTGLKGRNNVEIYKGDVVIPRYNGFKAFVVEYEKGKFNVAGFDVDNVEVLGNIFENPNLLEQS